MLKENTNIDGVVINNIKCLLGMYADDIWNVIRNNQKSLDALLQMYEWFRDCTGLHINYDKTEVMRIGSLSDSCAKLYSIYPLQWTSGPVTILGIDIYNDSVQTAKCNYIKFKDKFKAKLNNWIHRGQTFDR